MLLCMRPKGTPKELERRRLRAIALLDKGVSRNAHREMSQKCIENEGTWLRRIAFLKVLSSLLCDFFDRMVRMAMCPYA